MSIEDKDRDDVMERLLELGGDKKYLTFDDLNRELPDNVGASALSMAISAGGAVKSVKTTPLLTFEEGIAALQKAKDAEYAPPHTEIPYFGVYRGAGV